MLHLTIVYYYKYFTQKYIYMYIHCTCTCILKLCAVDRGFEPRSGNNVFEWGEMSVRGLLLQ